MANIIWLVQEHDSVWLIIDDVNQKSKRKSYKNVPVLYRSFKVGIEMTSFAIYKRRLNSLKVMWFVQIYVVLGVKANFPFARKASSTMWYSLDIYFVFELYSNQSY